MKSQNSIPSNKKISKKLAVLVSFVVLAIALPVYFIWSIQSEPESYDDNIESHGNLSMNMETNTKPKSPVFLYGLSTDSFEITRSSVQKGESLGKILDQQGINSRVIHEIVQASKDIFDVRHWQIDNKYVLFHSRDSTGLLKYLVYEKSLYDYIVFDLSDSIKVYQGLKTVSKTEKFASGTINSSLSQTIEDEKLSPQLAHKIEDIYAWTINFFRLQKGDQFKVVYEDTYIDDSIYAGPGKILAATFTHAGHEYNAFSFLTPDSITEYFDEEGKSMRKSFLMAPLKTYRISSRYTRRRFHPVQKRWKAHKGTDFAAPKGTPIMSTATGKVIKAGYTSGNGNYVKIEHNSKYTTQYLHMTKFAKGIKAGKVVKQGDVIGYVGSTGLATGPHVCYRFWVNGIQVDPYSQKLPDAEPIKEEWKSDFLVQMDLLRLKLSGGQQNQQPV